MFHGTVRKLLALAAAAAALLIGLSAPARAQPAVAIDADDIGGVVTGPSGPEAGVWVIAETRDLPVRYIKMRRHRRSRPLRRARSAEGELQRLGARLRPRRQRRRSRPSPASVVNLTATPAPNAAAAAQYYPAIYWYSMLHDSRRRASSAARAAIPGDITQHRLAQHDEEQRLRRLPSARPPLDAHDSGSLRRRSRRPRTPGCAACSRARPAR